MVKVIKILLAFIANFTIQGGEFIKIITAAGVPHSTVQVLDSSNFEDAITDPANGLWFLKFYAPWCGHCKKMAPVLDKVAPHLAGKMAIGKIDCTVEKSLCKKYDVKGYPTLIIYRDGDTFPYPGERHADSIIQFAEKMSANAVVETSTYNDAVETASTDKGGNGVVFVAYDPEAKGNTLEEKLQSTTLTQVFGQVARKQQAAGNFVLLDSSATSDEIVKFGGGSEPFIAKAEQSVESQVYSGKLNSADLLSFVKSNNLALVTELGSSNFRDVGRMGKPLAIGVIDPKADNTEFLSELRNVAATSEIKSDYIFSTINGIQWNRFLSQFNVDSNKLPVFFILDVPTQTYWEQPSNSEENAKEPLSMEDLLNAHSKGKLDPKEQGSGSIRKPWYTNPWFVLGLVAVTMTIFFVLPLSDEEMEAINTEEEPSKDDSKKEK